MIRRILTDLAIALAVISDRVIGFPAQVEVFIFTTTLTILLHRVLVAHFGEAVHDDAD